MSKKNKKKKPAQKRDRGTPIDLSDRKIPEEKVEEKCEEVIKKEIIRGTITNYKNNQVTIQYEETKMITHKIENHFLTFSKDILFGKKFNKKKNIEEVIIIYMQLLPKDLQGIEIENLALKLNHFPLMELKDKNEVKFHFQDSYCVEYEQKKIDDYYSAIKKLGLKYFDKSFSTSYRLVIGGEATVYETSIRLHHIYGIPFIPASAIKGVVRSYIISEKFGNKEEDALKDDEFVKVFGSQDKAGKVTFFDAFPTSKPTIKVDIMNPHYGDYYSDKKNKVAPTDTMKLNPINFLTVENTTFEFFIASRDEIDKQCISLFEKALKNHGIGGKTAVGYGYFD